jgi:RNA polymerase sigma-70 factor (ECF subfamily)
MDIETAYTAYFSELYVYAMSIVHAKQDAEDVVLTVFSKILEDPARFEKLEKPRAYLYASVRSRALNLIEHNAFITADDSELSLEEEQKIEQFKLTADMIKAIMDGLTKQQRKVLNGLLKDMDIHQLAAFLGTTKATVRSVKRDMLNRVRKMLSSHLNT